MATNQEGWMKALYNVIGKNNNGKRLDDVVSKKKLADVLIAPRIEEIEEELAKNPWKPKPSIEEIIQKIFRMFPYRL